MKHQREFRLGKCLALALVATIVILASISAYACTIFSAKAENGEVWNGNNEDYELGKDTYINVYPKEAPAKYGFYSLSYDPAHGADGGLQGGMNEAGLTIDFNSVDESEVLNKANKKDFPEGDNELLPHILRNFSTVEEVVAFFDTYWFKGGFTSAQMHIADRFGHFAIVSPTGSQILTDKKFQVSTNFRVCGGTKEEGATCWRFPIATVKLQQQAASLESFTDIARSTAVKNGTLYTNIQNLSTGDVWFYFAQDYDTPFKTSLKELLSMGRKSYLMKDLGHRTGFADKANAQ